jgi:hypothetical protein
MFSIKTCLYFFLLILINEYFFHTVINTSILEISREDSRDAFSKRYSLRKSD